MINEKYDIIKEIEYNNEKYTLAENKENNNFIIFDISGKACFGGEHFWILDFVTIDNITYLKVRHKRNGKVAFLDRYGNPCTLYGGEHWIIYDFVSIDNVKYLKAQHERCGKIEYYDRDGYYDEYGKFKDAD